MLSDQGPGPHRPLIADSRLLLPRDSERAVLVGRIWMPKRGRRPAGPCVVRVAPEGVYDLTPEWPTAAHLLNSDDPVAAVVAASARRLAGTFVEVAEASLAGDRSGSVPRFLAPVDLQPVKACGVTYYDSLLERLIEERTGGLKQTSAQARQEIVEGLGGRLDHVVPGSTEAVALLQLLRKMGLWSQYLEVAIGEYAEIFTKALPLSCVGAGDAVGILPYSRWSNPEPEVTLILNSHGRIVGATLGNDVNHRDIEGRSALLLGRAKDNNAGCALGPFIRLLDASFTLDGLRQLRVDLEVDGADGFRLHDFNSMSRIRRDIVDIAAQCMGPCNPYPDGVALMLGAMCSVKQDRFGAGEGFTHVMRDIVRISSPELGLLPNYVGRCDEVPPWSMGLTRLMDNLAERGYLRSSLARRTGRDR